MRLFLLIILSFALPACSYDHTRYGDPDDGPDNVVYQFIDAETMKPIQGAYVNPIWMKPTPAGKVGSPGCIRAALLRSDANGWVRMKGPKGGILSNINYMVPGYDFFDYKYKNPDDQHVLNFLRAEKSEVTRYPAWAKSLEDLGYTYGYGSYWIYYKSFPITGFKDNQSAIKKPQTYFIKHRALPNDSVLSTFISVDRCGPEGENINLDTATLKEVNAQRGRISANVLCDEKWDTAAGPQPYGELEVALWLVDTPQNASLAREKFTIELPDYPKILSPQWGRSFTKRERLVFCKWIRPFSEKYQ